MRSEERHHAVWVLLSLGLFVAITSGCGSDDKPAPVAACPEGTTHTCTGTDGCLGVQICDHQGNWSQCACNTQKGLLGGACSDDSACPEGAYCLLPDSKDWLGGGPPSGICAADCSGDVGVCTAQFANAICVAAVKTGSTGPKTALCMPACNLTVGAKDALACAGVPHSACDQLEDEGVGFCRPFCQFDADCPSAHCDRQVGVCVGEVAATPPLGFGEGCAPEKQDCNGVCLRVYGDIGVCTNRCLYDQNDFARECGISGSTPIAGICAYATEFEYPGNVGYCAPLCDCNGDCLATGFVCRAFGDPDAKLALKHEGMCIYDPNGSVVGLPCEGGG